MVDKTKILTYTESLRLNNIKDNFQFVSSKYEKIRIELNSGYTTNLL